MKVKRKFQKKLTQESDRKEDIQKKCLPMKQRTFPPSFWEPPNKPLPFDALNSMVTKNEKFETRTGRIKITSPPDTNLLFSLFKILEPKIGSTMEPESNIVIKSVKKTRTQNQILRNQNEITEDQTFGVLDDPYLSIEQNIVSGNHHHQQQQQQPVFNSKNYSDILSDLVVNL